MSKIDLGNGFLAVVDESTSDIAIADIVPTEDASSVLYTELQEKQNVDRIINAMRHAGVLMLREQLTNKDFALTMHTSKLKKKFATEFKGLDTLITGLQSIRAAVVDVLTPCEKLKLDQCIAQLPKIEMYTSVFDYIFKIIGSDLDKLLGQRYMVNWQNMPDTAVYYDDERVLHRRESSSQYSGWHRDGQYIDNLHDHPVYAIFTKNNQKYVSGPFGGQREDTATAVYS